MSTKLKELQETVTAAHKALVTAESALMDYREEVCHGVLGAERNVSFSRRVCKASPVEVCVYDDDDVSHDSCLFCHDPYEQK